MKRLQTTIGLAGMSLAMLATLAQAQDGRAPRIYVSSGLGSSVASSYVEPSVSLSEDAYVFAISVDVDRNVRILHPEFPGLAVKMNATRDLHLPKFFTGYGERDREMNARRGGYVSSYYNGYDAGYSDSRGTVIALASRRPFDFDVVTTNGDWNLETVRRLVSGRDPQSAASVLAQRLGAHGEEIGWDVYRFAGESRTYSTLYNTGAYQCSPYYGALGYSRGLSQFRTAQLRRAGYRVTFIGIDACGEPRYAVQSRNLVSNPGQRPPARGAFPRPTTPTQQVPRNPARTRPRASEPAEPSPSGRPTRRYAEPAQVAPRNVPSRERERNPAATGRRPQAARGSFPERARVVPSEPRPRAAEPARRPAPTARTERPARSRPAARGALPRESRARPVD